MEPFGTAVFCDDIRSETFNKFSLMGVYGYELVLFGKFPAMLPRLGIFMSLRVHISQKVDGAKILTYFPGDAQDAPTRTEQINVKLDSETFSLPDPNEYPDPSEFYGFNHHVLFSPAVINQHGFIRVRAIIGGHRIKVGSLKLREALPEEKPEAAKSTM